MKHKEISEAFEKVFKNKEEEFKSLGALDLGFVRISGDAEDGSGDLSVAYFDFEYHRIELVYAYSVPLNPVRSFLDCRLYLDKRDTLLWLSLYELTYSHFSAHRHIWMYPYIESPCRMEQCANELLSSLKSVLPSLSLLAENKEMCGILYSDAKKRMITLFKKDIFADDENQSESILPLQISYFMGWRNNFYSSSDFLALLEGKNTINMKKYIESAAEAELQDFVAEMYKENKEIEENRADLPFEIPKNCDTVGDFKRERSPKSSIPVLVLSVILFLPLFFIGFEALYLIITKTAFRNAIYVTNSISHSFALLTPVLICTVVYSFFARKSIIKIFYRGQKKEKKLAYYDILNSGVKKIFRFIFNFAVILSIIITALISCKNIALYPESFSDNSALLPLAGQAYRYSDIERVYIIENSGVAPNYDTMVIITSDGKKTQTGTYDRTAEIESILSFKGIIVERIGSASEIK